MTFLHQLIHYITKMWHEFAQTVHLEEKKGTKSFWHQVNKWVIALPIGAVFFLLGIVVLVAALMAVAPVAKMFGYDLASKFSKIQAKYQAKFRPSMWFPCFSDMHSARQKWTSVAAAEGVYKDIVQVVKNMEQNQKEAGETFEVVETDSKKMRVKLHVYSPKMKSLDVVELECKVGEDMGGAEVDAFSFSSGFGPLALPPPFGVLSSLALFWLPYSDKGQNKTHLDDIRASLKSDIRLEVSEEKGKSD